MHEAAQNFELLSNIQDQKKKLLAVYVLFKVYPMVPLSCRSNLQDDTFNVLLGFYFMVGSEPEPISDLGSCITPPPPPENYIFGDVLDIRIENVKYFIRVQYTASQLSITI